MKSHFFALLFTLCLITSPAANANDNKKWADISDVSAAILVGSSLAVPAFHQDWTGAKQALYSLGAAEGASILGKAVVHERRPDKSDNNSFPSGHTALAFAAATTMYRRYGWEYGAPAYALATLAGYARVDARKHHWYDVVAGGAIGAASGWYFTDAFNDKVQFVPWADSKSVGFEASIAW